MNIQFSFTKIIINPEKSSKKVQKKETTIARGLFVLGLALISQQVILA